VKAEVATELPKKTEVVIYHGMSALQKKYYKAILMKDLDAFENEMAKKVKLQNVLSQLRKCVDHPYLFDGVEPEPFEIGDHLIEASGKLHLLDKLLAFLYSRGHRVLLFSQMTQMLDILQDYMDYRGYSYERVDGSVRGEERHLAIKNFGQQPVFIFLLSTRAGQLSSSEPQSSRVMSSLPPCLLAKLTPLTRKERRTDLICFLMPSESPQGPFKSLQTPANCCGCRAFRVSGLGQP